MFLNLLLNTRNSTNKQKSWVIGCVVFAEYLVSLLCKNEYEDQHWKTAQVKNNVQSWIALALISNSMRIDWATIFWDLLLLEPSCFLTLKQCFVLPPFLPPLNTIKQKKLQRLQSTNSIYFYLWPFPILWPPEIQAFHFRKNSPVLPRGKRRKIPSTCSEQAMCCRLNRTHNIAHVSVNLTSHHEKTIWTNSLSYARSQCWLKSKIERTTE